MSDYRTLRVRPCGPVAVQMRHGQGHTPYAGRQWPHKIAGDITVFQQFRAAICGHTATRPCGFTLKRLCHKDNPLLKSQLASWSEDCGGSGFRNPWWWAVIIHLPCCGHCLRYVILHDHHLNEWLTMQYMYRHCLPDWGLLLVTEMSEPNPTNPGLIQTSDKSLSCCEFMFFEVCCRTLWPNVLILKMLG